MSKTALQQAREAPGSTKARILGAAEEVFAARGFTGASTREIAAKAGVNISSLHYHWASKETLYVAVLRNVFDQLVALVQDTVETLQGQSADRRAVIDHAMDRLFDFFADNPTVPTLLVRRIVENADIDVGVERDVLGPAWNVFSSWMRQLGQNISETEARLFMLSVHSVVVVYLLDSQPYRSALGGSIREPVLREQVRSHVKHLVHVLLGV